MKRSQTMVLRYRVSAILHVAVSLSQYRGDALVFMHDCWTLAVQRMNFPRCGDKSTEKMMHDHIDNVARYKFYPFPSCDCLVLWDYRSNQLRH